MKKYYDQQNSTNKKQTRSNNGIALHAPGFVQTKLRIGAPNDKYEKEADNMADKVVQLHASSTGTERPADIQRKSTENRHLHTAGAKGSPMPFAIRSEMEGVFHRDFSKVKIHTGSNAVQMSQALQAKAFTHGNDLYFNRGEYNPDSKDGKHLLAHELTHVVQQRSAGANSKGDVPDIQRRLVAFGTLPDITALTGLLSAPSGLTLNHDPVTSQIVIGAVAPGAPPSPTLRARLTTIINHPTQHAEIVVARGQQLVFVGAFPQPTDLTVSRVQRVDIDDILAVEAGAPGNGVAFAMHEIEENFQAHGVPAVAGTDRFADAHEIAETQAENPVASELVQPGRRVATVTVPGTIVPSLVIPLPFGGNINIPGSINPAANTTALFFDYENYYLGMTRRFVPATRDVQVLNAGRFPKQVISSNTIDNFGSGANALPGGAAGAIAAAAASVAANPTATVRIQGFTDNTGGAAINQTVSQQRADAIQAALVAAGVAANRIHSEGLGATNFVAPNATEADRARNRRVVITVTTPQL